jgi:mevalonate pyrophosphate decarboxylase
MARLISRAILYSRRSVIVRACSATAGAVRTVFARAAGLADSAAGVAAID